jgi:phenylacetate-CoA ligase
VESIHKWIFWWGAKRRNPSLFRQFEELKQSENLSRQELEDRNIKELKSFIRFAGKHSEFYKKMFSENGFDPDSNWTLEDFSRLYTVSKKDLIEFNAQVHTNISKTEKTFFCETSGTSGQILTFRRDEFWDSFNRAAIWRGLSWYGVNPWDFSLYFWGYNSDKWKKLKLRFLDFLVNRYRIFDYDFKSMSKLGPKLSKVVAIEGYSSMIYELAKINEHAHLKFPKLKMVKGTSEKIFPHYQEVALKVYGQRTISEYGSAESGIIAFECPLGSMHINLEGVFLEKDTETQSILVTNLKSRSFPVIRYALGDDVEFAPKDFFCPCGRPHPVIREVTGRIGKRILGSKRSYPSLTLYYIFKNLYFNKGRKIDFQAHQKEKGKLEIWVKEPVTQELSDLIDTEANLYFTDIELLILEKYDFREQKGKLRDFVSYLN